MNTTAMHRLSQEAFLELERQLLPPPPTHLTTDIQAGFSLGVSHALRVLRTGFTVG